MQGNIIQKKSAYPLGISKYFSTLSLQILTLKNRNYGKNCKNQASQKKEARESEQAGHQETKTPINQAKTQTQVFFTLKYFIL